MQIGMNFYTTRAVILCYPGFAGGKFLSNCLSLSQGACPQDPVAAQYLLKDSSNYKQRLSFVMSSLPPAHQIKNWRDFEFGDIQMFGESAVTAWHQGLRADSSTVVQQLTNSDMYFFIVNHVINPTTLLKVWPEATVLVVVNHLDFQNVCLRFKSQIDVNDITGLNGNYCEKKYQLLRGPDWPDWQHFEQHGYCVSRLKVAEHIRQEMSEFYYALKADQKLCLFDIGSCIWDGDRFAASMQSLYQQLDLKDFNRDLVLNYWQAYIRLHEPYR